MINIHSHQGKHDFFHILSWCSFHNFDDTHSQQNLERKPKLVNDRTLSVDSQQGRRVLHLRLFFNSKPADTYSPYSGRRSRVWID